QLFFHNGVTKAFTNSKTLWDNKFSVSFLTYKNLITFQAILFFYLQLRAAMWAYGVPWDAHLEMNE
ncbi:hypothetical protein, partial [Salmonella sp. gx-f7]|uniref:hypothetical protein n=1 Tax=Salmonella sp. gx-f7 TaxID=2582606 RepID=UPI001F1CFF34